MDKDGASDAVTVGEPDGAVEGSKEGAPDAVTVGKSDGADVGFDEGDEDGMIVGSEEGLSDAVTEGGLVGASVINAIQPVGDLIPLQLLSPNTTLYPISRSIVDSMSSMESGLFKKMYVRI